MTGILDHLAFGADEEYQEQKLRKVDFEEDEKDEAEDEEISTLPVGLGVAAGLGAFFKQDRFSDVTFVVGDEKDESKRARIGAHRVILAARSPVFEAMLYPAFDQQQKEGELKKLRSRGLRVTHFVLLYMAFIQEKRKLLHKIYLKCHDWQKNIKFKQYLARVQRS